MCGIAGAAGNLTKTDYDFRPYIAHRGPDGDGVFAAPNVVLAHTRLAILDLSENGRQPMQTTDGRYVITFNGEIYNHLGLRAELERRGYRFRSTSDTETLLHGFAAYGTDVFRRLNGIFACGIYDTLTKQLTLARDQFGVKPLYYYLKDGLLLFASELKAIAHYPGMNRSIDYGALTNYLHFLYAPGEQTPFRYVRKLLPGHWMQTSVNDVNHAKPVSFYTIPFTGQYNERSENDLLDALDEHLKRAVERQLQSDVPLGFFLSGGLDSSAIVALAKELRPNEVLTCYTIRTEPGRNTYEGFANDLPYARRVADYLGVKLVEVEAEADMVRDFDRVIYHLDEPLSDTAPINVLNICRKARKNGHVVLLGGTAGDDVFSGYRRHQALVMEPLLNLIPNGVARGLSYGLDQLQTDAPLLRRMQKVLRGLTQPTQHRRADYFGWLPNELNRSLFAEEVLTHLPDGHPRQRLLNALGQIPDEHNRLNQMLFWEMNYYLPDHNLSYTDKLSMAVGVETRVPFLDLELVAFSASLPPALKMKGATTKYLLRKVMERYLPKDVIYRSKTGFGTPLRRWFRTGKLTAITETYLSEDVLMERGIFNPTAVARLMRDNQQGKIDASYTIWGLMAMESWFRQFVDVGQSVPAWPSK